MRTSADGTGPIHHGSAAGRVYAKLRGLIISLDLPPDTVLSRADLAREHEVSQSPVREAIQELEKEGLVISFPQSKTVVSKIDIEHARDTQFLRLGVELEVARTLASTSSAELLLPTSRILRMQKMAGEDQDIAEFTALDRLFHLSLFEAAGVPSLWHLIAGRSGHIDRLRMLNLPDPGKMSQVLASHEKILSAISNSDLAAAEQSVRHHLTGTLASANAIRDAHPAYFARQ
ncbi:GntR family transcriptional regulator [Roseibium salinum]|uniref:GntR family transcriptional regulator n=1 Tax=Roseibium salinum TaxID=1604349 RepID=A0ABT3QVY3_9HYPH|nr:GntR family transcriptional regulator [Roseibium sp. DSM 29163]MCX2721082.1 GntR family transcriptional regulator [Roseibium sp. DSM 29163]